MPSIVPEKSKTQDKDDFLNYYQLKGIENDDQWNHFRGGYFT